MGIIRLNAGYRMNEGHRMDEPPAAITPVPPPVLRKKKAHIMNNDWMPHQRDTRYRFYKNLSDNVVTEAAKAGVVAADATAVKTVADGILAKMDATDTAQEGVDAARELERQTEAGGQQTLRAKVKNWKTLSGWSGSGVEQTLQLTGTGSAFDSTSYKTTLKVSSAPGGVRVDFAKKGVSAMNIYTRISGQANWRKVGMATEAPFIDATPLAQTGTPEVREYAARGLLHDEEIGQLSDAARITFAG